MSQVNSGLLSWVKLGTNNQGENTINCYTVETVMMNGNGYGFMS